MPKDIFNIDTVIGGAWQMDGAVISIAGADDIVVNDCQVTYQRAATKFSPLNQRKRYLVVGEAAGRIAIGTIFGPSPSIKQFLTQYANACNVMRNVMAIQPTGTQVCQGATIIEFLCNGVLLDNLAIQVTQVGQGMTMVQGGLGMTFVSLQLQ